MNNKHLLFIGIILFPFFWSQKADAQQGVRRQRHITVNQTIVDGKVISSDTLIFETDTVRQRTLQSKEISMELPYTKGTTLHINNTYRKLNIRQSKDNKVRLSTTAFYYAEPSFTNEQWFEKLNIKTKNTDTGLMITSGGMNRSTGRSVSGYSYWSSSDDTTAGNQSNGVSNGMTITQNGASRETKLNGMTVTQNGAYQKTRLDSGALKGTTVIQNGAYRSYTPAVRDAPSSPRPPVATSPAGVRSSRPINGTTIYGRATTDGTFTTGNWPSYGNANAVFDEQANVFYNSNYSKAEITIYVPAAITLDVTSRYANVSVDHDVSSIKANISNASLDMLNATDAVILSTYGTLSAGNLVNADISSTSGKVFVKDVARLQLNTRYTKVETGNCGWLKTQSISDDYDIDEVKNFEGQKTYGSLRVDKLTGTFDLKGSSADLKIRNIQPSVSSIIIDNKYADVRLPVATLKNYEVHFSGNYSSVFAPFDRKDDAVQNNAVQNTDNGNTSYTNSNGSSVSSTWSGASSRKRTNSFTSVVGDVKGMHTSFKLTCTSCNVDFK